MEAGPSNQNVSKREVPAMEQAGTSMEGDKRKRQADTSKKGAYIRKQQKRNIKQLRKGKIVKIGLDLEAIPESTLKQMDSGSSSEDEDDRSRLDQNDNNKTLYYSGVKKKVHIIQGRVPSLQDIARPCIVNLPYLRQYLKGLKSHFLEALELLGLLDPAQLFEIDKWKSKKDRKVTDKYWKKFCNQAHIKLIEEDREPNDREISYRSLFEKERRLKQKQARKLDKAMIPQLEPVRKWGSFFNKKKFKATKIPIWKQPIPSDESTDSSDDSQRENAEYPSDPDADNDSEISDLSVDKDLCYFDD